MVAQNFNVLEMDLEYVNDHIDNPKMVRTKGCLTYYEQIKGKSKGN